MQRLFSFYYFVFFVAMAATQPFLSLYLSGKGIDSTHIGFLLAAGSGAGMFAQPILGSLNDQASDPRRILILSALLSPILYAGYALTRQFWPLLLVAVLYAIAQSTAPIMDAITVQEGARSGFAYGKIRLWGALSFALTTMVAGYIYHLIGIQASFIVYGGLSVILILAILLLPKTKSLQPSQDKLLQGILQVARGPALITFIVICFILSMAISINFSFLPLYFQDLHYPMGWVGMNFTVAALVEVPFFYISSRIIKRLGLMPVVILASILYTLKYTVMIFNPGAAVVISIQVLDGIAYALYWSAAVQLVSNLSPNGKTATAQTLFGAIAGSLSGIVGTSFGGWFLEQFGPLLLYGCVTGLGALSVCCFILFARFTRQSVSSDFDSVQLDVH
ncbi:MFS transporter [Alicyclobacillus fodiniaquatilis]|uniref:MFS transporter n=1 Tax=Alicyclobacillus fodiniaquatilis TaxID=1661150 RepID=A0ABW4JJH0_9BACL